MTKYIGRRASLGLAKEASRGVPVAPTYWIPIESCDFNDKADKQLQKSAFGVLAANDSSYVVQRYAEGGFSFHLEDKVMGLILLNLLGAVVDAGSTNYTHTYTYTNTNNHQSLSFAEKNPNETKIMALGMIDSFSIKVEPNGFSICDVSCVSKNGKDWGTLTPAYTAPGNKFLHQHLAFKVAANIAGIAAASAISLKGLTFEIKKNLIKENSMGTLQPEDILNQEMQVTGEIVLSHDDVVWRDYLLNGTEKAIEIRFTYGTNNYLYFQLPKCTFDKWELDGALSDIVNQKLTFVAHYDYANAQQQIYTAVLANQTASY